MQPSAVAGSGVSVVTTAVALPLHGSLTVNVGGVMLAAHAPPGSLLVATAMVGVEFFHVYATLTVSAFSPHTFAYAAVHTFVCVQPLMISEPSDSVTCGLSAHSSLTLKLSTVITGISSGLQPRSRMPVPCTAVMVGFAGDFTSIVPAAVASHPLPSVTETVSLYIWPQSEGIVKMAVSESWSAAVTVDAGISSPRHT